MNTTDINAQQLLQDLVNAGVKKEQLHAVVDAIINLTYCESTEAITAATFRAKNWANAYNTIAQLKPES